MSINELMNLIIVTQKRYAHMYTNKYSIDCIFESPIDQFLIVFNNCHEIFTSKNTNNFFFFFPATI